MYSIDLMIEEHENIRRMLKVMHAMCCGILEGAAVEGEDIRTAIDFARNYADKHHHGKEEKFLFPEMVATLGPAAESLVTHGMLVEHDLGRAHLLEAETALGLYEEDPKTEYKLDLITEVMGYAHLLQRHIEKENSVVYTFAERSLEEALKEDIDRRAKEYEAQDQADAVRKKYLEILASMEAKYGIAE